MSLNIAIIGAGICGLTIAKRLQQVAKVTVFEKSRGLGGRMATRYHQHFEFDHGLPYFSISDPMRLQELQSSGLVQPWLPRFIHFSQKQKWQDEVLVSAPRMNSWAKYLASDLSIQLTTQISKIEWKDEQSTLFDQDGLTYGPFDWVISTAPWPQAENLFGEHLVFNFPKMQAQKVYLLGFNQDFNLDFDVGLFNDPVLEKIVVNSTKPGRQHAPSIVVYAKQDLDIRQVIKDYLPFAPSYMDEHFWRFAYSKAAQKHDILFSIDRHWVVGGDWLRPSPGLEASLMVAEEIIQFILGKL